MALTVNTVPDNIDNSGAYNVTTSLSEDASHVNLRIRADVTVSAVVIGTVEKPKGLPDFDISDMLASMVTGISFARDSGDLYKVSGGSPLVAYTILFTEVWEDGDGVTTTGDTDNASGTTYRYVPARGDGTAFSTFVMTGTSSKFANLTLRNNITKFYTYNPVEMWLVFFTEVAEVELFYSKDGGAADHATHITMVDGWGVIVINIGELMASVVTSLTIQLGEVGGAKISEVLTIYPDTTCIDERVILEYDGLIGGKEYLAFEGITDIEFVTARNYYIASTNNRKPLYLTGKNRQTIETRFKDINNASYLRSLLMSYDVKKLEPLYATPTNITITSDNAIIDRGIEMFTNKLDIEYEY